MPSPAIHRLSVSAGEPGVRPMVPSGPTVRHSCHPPPNHAQLFRFHLHQHVIACVFFRDTLSGESNACSTDTCSSSRPASRSHPASSSPRRYLCPSCRLSRLPSDLLPSQPSTDMLGLRIRWASGWASSGSGDLHQIIGVGSGSTVPYVVDRIVAQGRDANRTRVFVPTGGSYAMEPASGAHLRLPEQGAHHQCWIDARRR